MSQSSHIAVIGAGPAGLTAAYQLSKAGAHVDVFEASPHLGGMSRSLSLWDQKVDLGPHRFFSNDPRVNGLWLEVVGKNYSMVSRLTRIFYQDRFFLYPLSPVNALLNLGPREALHCLGSYVAQRFRSSDKRDDFESWVTQRFGRRLFEVFFKSYSEKLWGIPCSELDSDFAAQRIKKLSLFEAVKDAFVKDRGKHKSLVDLFAYPHGGTGSVYEKMAEEVIARGGKVHLETPVERVLTEGSKVIGVELKEGSRRDFDFVVSTMPLTHLVAKLADTPAAILEAARKLKFRHLTLVYLLVEGTDLFKDNWLYVHSPEYVTGRITNFRNWVPNLYGTSKNSILCLEYWSNDNDPLWREPDETLITRGKHELSKTKLIGSAAILKGHVVKVPRCYPVYEKGYKENLKPVTEHLRRFSGLLPIGRYGSFKYNNQDHSILMGMLAAENILEDRRHDLWSINSDNEYQESAIITENGLERVLSHPSASFT